MKFRRIANAALALSFLAYTIQAQAPRAAYDQLNRGNSQYQKGDLEAAIASFTKAIEISSSLDNGAGSGDWKKGLRPEEAIANFNKVGVIDPLTAIAYSNRGLARFQMRDYEGAIS